jgi:hypothetical protein
LKEEKMKALRMLVILFGVAAAGARAETILPVSCTSTSEHLPGWVLRTITPDGALNVGLKGLHTETVDSRQHSGSGWVSKANQFIGCNLQYDLGGPYNLTGMKIYNGALKGQYARGVKQIDVQVSNDAVNWVDVATDQLIRQNTGSGAEWQTLGFTVNNCRYVRIIVDSNYGASYAEIAKVQFEGTGAVGQTVVTPASVSTTMGAFDAATWAIENTINKTGIRTPSDMMNSSCDDNTVFNWVSAAGSTTGEIVWQFAEPQSLQSMLVWNGNDGAKAFRAVKQYDLLVSPDAAGENWIAVVTDGTLVLTTNSDIWLGPQAVGINKKGVRRVKMVVDANHGDPTHTMLNEVAFIALGK